MKRIFLRELGRNYLVLETETEDADRGEEDKSTVQGPSYAMTMAERNHISAFLPIHSQEVNGRMQFWYEITSKQPLTVLFETALLREGQIKALYQSMDQALKGAGEYLLEPDGLLFSPEEIYMDPDTFLCAFCFLDDGKATEKVHSEHLEELAQFLLKKTDHTDRAAVRLVYPFYAGVKDAKKDLQQLLTELLEDEMNPQGQSDGSERTKTGELISENRTGSTPEKISENVPLPIAGEIFSDQEQANLDWGMFEHDQTGESQRQGSRRRILVLSLLGGSFLLGGAAAWYLLSLDLTQAGALGAALIALWWMLHRMLFPGEKEQGRKQKKKTARSQEEEFWKVLYGEQGESAAGGKSPLDFEPPSGVLPETGDSNRVAGAWNIADPARQQPADITFEGSGVTECILLADRIPEGQEASMKEPLQQPVLYLKRKNARAGKDIIPGEVPLLIGKKKEQVNAWINSPSVSRIHARLEMKEEALFLTDLHSTNGTYVNGELLPPNAPRILEIGDEVRFADVVYLVRQRIRSFQDHA